MNNWRLLKVFKIVLLVLAAICLFGFLVMKLWNWLMPEIFGLPLISFTQALGVLLLSKILFSGFKPGGPGHSAKERWKNNFFKKRWEKKLANLSPEEREKLKNDCKKTWGGWCSDDDDENSKS